MVGPSADRESGAGTNRESTVGMPRWVKVSIIIALVAVALFVVLLLTGGPGRHGPGRHTGGLGDRTPSVSTIAAYDIA